jgi:hypothetical protein
MDARGSPDCDPIATPVGGHSQHRCDPERDLGRIAADADVDTLAATLIGAVHLLFADRNATPPEAGAVRKTVTTVLAGALPR